MKTAILITLSQQLIKEYPGGYSKIITEWQNSDGTQSWFYKCGNAPKQWQNIIWVYWVIKGRIRYRCHLLTVAKNTKIRFDGHPIAKYAKNWLVLFDFQKIPRRIQVERKGFQGFQGFRYYDDSEFNDLVDHNQL